MSSFRIPKFDDLRQSFMDLIRAYVPEAALQVGEDYEREANILAGASQSLLGPLTTIEDQIFPDTANDENVLLHGELEGMTRKQPDAATGLAVFPGDLSVLPPISQLSGSTATSVAGVNVFLTASGACVLPAWVEPRLLVVSSLNSIVVSSTAGMASGDAFVLGGHIYVIRDLPGGGAIVIYGKFVTIPDLTGSPVLVKKILAMVCQIQASDVGEVGNLEFDTPLTLDAPTSGIAPGGTVVLLSGGANLESLGDFGRRIKLHRQIKPRDANASAHREWMEDIVGVARGFNYSLYRGLGTADDVPQGVAGARHLSPVKRAEIQTDINPAFPLIGRVPAGGHDVQITDFTDLFVNIDLSIVGGPGYGPDWGPVARNGYYQGFGGTFTSLGGRTLVFSVDNRREFMVFFDAFAVDAATTAFQIQTADPVAAFFTTSVVGGQVRITSRDISFNSGINITTPNASAGFPALGAGIRGGTIVVGAGSTASRINTTIDPSSIITVGTRVVFAQGPKFLEQTVVVLTDAMGFTLKNPLSSIPAVGSLVYPGSPLIEPIRDLLIATVDDVGPGDTTPPSRLPSPTDEFPADLTLNLIHSTVRKIKGVRDVKINLPSQNVNPPPKAQIQIGGMILRYFS